ncbi:MAG: ABC transporter ATP-binding protein [Rhizobiales bacterium]|nr:ABC transporter ATP-binding protein [Hyphomicrobiales bacterium]OJY42898.1 MAG: hypothetical protein BGP08_19500 [Rhizobiales bacterium 64-17]
MTALLEIRNLSLSFGGLHVLHDIGLSLNPGEIVGMIGPNGAGKSALVNCICGLYPPSSGSRIDFDNLSLVGMPPHRVASLGISRTFQHMYLNESMTVLENVLIGAASQFRGGVLRRYVRPYASSREEADARHQALTSLERCGIADIALRPVAGLPLGIRRRVDLARALVRTPKLLLIDEPASGLANDERALVRDLIGIAQTSDNVAVIWIEHDLELVVSAATRVAVLHHGRIVAEGSPQSEQERKRLIDAYLIGNIPPTQGG